jgi:hypothetical protein
MKTPKKDLEKDLLINTKKILNVFKNQGLISYTRMHVMPIMRGGRMTVNKDMQGVEDLQVYMFGGKLWCIELKSLKGKQSEHQKAREIELKALGFDYSIIRTVDELLSNLRQRGLSCWAFPR